MLSNLHTHTIFCDGKDELEDIVIKALELGFDQLGFSGHSYTFFDERYCMSIENTKKYIEQVLALKQKYKGKIDIKLGIEQDYFSKEKTDKYEYVIGSVHYVKKDGKYLPVDEDKEFFIETVKKYYNGDYYAFVEDYYALVGDIVNKTHCDIVGHFDLITKFNSNNDLFDENNPRYINAYKNALKELFKTNVTFEINYGAVARKIKKEPYPSNEIIELIKKNGNKLIKTSDCHNKDFLLVGLK